MKSDAWSPEEEHDTGTVTLANSFGILIGVRWDRAEETYIEDEQELELCATPTSTPT